MDLDPEKQELLKEQIEKLKTFIDSNNDGLEKIIEYKQKYEDPTSDEEIKKLIDCPHEIIFTITAHTLAQNEKGEIVGSKNICVKNYHIPVPIDKDHHNYMTVFFDYLEKKIIDSVDNANQTAKDKEETV